MEMKNLNNVYFILFCFLLLFKYIARGEMYSMPSNEYVFSIERDALIEAERKFEQRDEILSKEEQTVDHYLHYLKWREFEATKNTGFPPSRPIEKVLNYIKSTEIYKALKKLPKGGILHSHEGHQLGKQKLMDIIWNSTDFEYLYMLPPNHPTKAWKLSFFTDPPKSTPSWINVKSSSFTRAELAKQQTMLALLTDTDSNLPTDSKRRWAIVNQIFGRGASNVISNLNIKKKYLEAMYEHGLEEGVTYFETRRGVADLFELDPESTTTNGQKILPGGIDADIDITLAIIENFKKSHPEFVGHKRIYYNARSYPSMAIKNDMETVLKSMSKYPNHVLGFDLVGEEDAGNSLLYYLENFLQFHDKETGLLKVPLYLHSAETNWYEDLLSSGNTLDPVATLQNTYESLLLNSKRMGHGIGFIKHPYLLQMLKKRHIALEICVVSNQMLGYSADIRNHPGQQFYRMGVPIVLAPDDPATFGYDDVTVDWYEAYMAWGLNLGDLKTLAINSLNYSGMAAEEKTHAIEDQWRPMWDKYIKGKLIEACKRNYSDEISKEGRNVTFAHIFPKNGALTGTTKVHVFGRNFEQALCKTIVCRFGTLNSGKAVYISNQHIVCEAPDFGDGDHRTVDLSVMLDGENFISTNLNFTYKFEAFVIKDEPEFSRAGLSVSNGFFLLHLFFILSILCYYRF